MQHIQDLPEISSVDTDKWNIIHVEVDGEYGSIADKLDSKEIIFVGRMGKEVVLILGIIVDREYVPENMNGGDFTKLKFQGTIVNIFTQIFNLGRNHD